MGQELNIIEEHLFFEKQYSLLDHTATQKMAEQMVKAGPGEYYIYIEPDFVWNNERKEHALGQDEFFQITEDAAYATVEIEVEPGNDVDDVFRKIEDHVEGHLEAEKDRLDEFMRSNSQGFMNRNAGTEEEF